MRSLFRNVRGEALRNFEQQQRERRRHSKRWDTVSNDGGMEDRLAGKTRGVVTRAMPEMGD